MSAPDVTLETQKHRHRTMLRGLLLGAGIALAAPICIVVGLAVFDVESRALIPAETEIAG